MSIALLPSAPYPLDTRAKGWRLELDQERLMQSDTWALATPHQRPWLLMFLLVAWQQTPCGSMPCSDQLIAVRLGMAANEFEQHRAILLRGWQKASDGRLYHPVVTQTVLEMLAKKSKETSRKADYRARHKAQAAQGVSHGTTTRQTRESGGSDATSTSTSKPYEAYASVPGKPETMQKPACPAEEVVSLYHDAMPNNPRVRVLNDARRKTIRARWKEASSLDCKPFGYSCREEGLAAWRQFFEVCADSDFLTGRAPAQPGKPPFVADIDFLMSPAGFTKCIENKYHREVAA